MPRRSACRSGRRPCSSSGSGSAPGNRSCWRASTCPAERFPGLLAADLEHTSLYELLTTRYGTRIVRAREWLEPVHPPRRVAELLGQDAHRPALLVESIAYGEHDVPVEYGRSYIRGDRTRYYVERVVVRSNPAALAAVR